MAAAADAALLAHRREPPGDVLVFLPGAEEVEEVCRLIRRGAPPPEDGGPALPSSRRGSAGTAAFVSRAATAAAATATAAGRARVSGSSGAAQAPNDDDWPCGRQLDVCPLHARLPWRDQLRALQPGRLARGSRRVRKVIVATSVAETSVTLPGVTVVVDSGFTRGPAYDAASGLTGLVTRPVSLAQAQQRAGRAGRVRAGKCLRLYPESAMRDLAPSAAPDIHCAPLAPLALQLLGLGVESLARFRYFEPPPATNMLRAVEDLAAVGALRSGAEEAAGALGAGGEAGGGVRLSWRGRWLAQLPVSPALGAMLLASLDPALHCAEECLSLAAVLSAGDPVLPPAEASRQLDDAAAKSKRRGHGGRAGSGDDSEGDDGEAGLMSFHRFLAAEGDHLTLVNMYSAWDANGRRDDWCRGFGLRPHVMRRAGDVRALLHRSLRRLLDQAAASRADAAGRNPATAAASKAHAADEPPASLCIGSCGGDGSLVLQAAVRGSPTNLASLGRNGAYVTVRGGRAAKLRAHCVLSQLTGDASVPPWVLYDSVTLSPSGQLMLGACSAVDPRWAVGAAGRAGLRLQEQDPTRARLAATIAEEAGDEGGELELDEAKLNAAIGAILRRGGSTGDAEAVLGGGLGREAATSARSEGAARARSAGLDGVAPLAKRGRKVGPEVGASGAFDQAGAPGVAEGAREWRRRSEALGLRQSGILARLAAQSKSERKRGASRKPQLLSFADSDGGDDDI